MDLRLVNKRVFESLIKAGAFDSVLASGTAAPPTAGRGSSRSWTGRSSTATRAAGPGARTGAAVRRHGRRGSPDGGIRLPDVEPWTPSEQLAFEKESLGLYLSGHPIDGYRDQLEAAGARTVDAPPAEDSTVFIGGIVSGYRPRKTRQGSPMAVFNLEDRTGSVEVVVFPKTWERCGDVLDADRLVVVAGRLDRDEEVPRVMAEDVRPIESLSGVVGRTLSIRLSTGRHGRETLQALADLFDMHRGPSWIRLHLELPEHRPPLRVQARLTEARVRPSEQLARAAERSAARERSRGREPGMNGPVTAPPRLVWDHPDVGEGRAEALAGAMDLDPVVARLLVLRGVTTADEAERFLRPRLEHLHDPFRLADLPLAVDRLERAIDQGTA